MQSEVLAYLMDRTRMWAITGGLEPYVRAAMFGAAAPSRRTRGAGSTMRSSDSSIAVLNVSGPITYKPTLFSALFGGSAVTALRAMFAQAMADESVKALVLNFDTPGGEVTGMVEFASDIAAA